MEPWQIVDYEETVKKLWQKLTFILAAMNQTPGKA
jgi:hypothetical protein